MENNDRQCTAKSKRSQQRCQKIAMLGQRVCSIHGGKTPVAIEKGKRVVAEQKARAALVNFGLPVEVDPHSALLQELHRTAGAVQWLGDQVQDLNRDEITWNLTEDVEGHPTSSTTRSATPHVYIGLWQQERKHLVDVSKACINAGIEERRVRLAEQAGQQLAQVVRAVLARLNLTEEQKGVALVAVPEEFRRLSEAS